MPNPIVANRLAPRHEAVFVQAARPDAAPADEPVSAPDRIVVVGGSAQTLDLLRLATIRSDDVLLVAEDIDEATRRVVDHFAVEYRAGPGSDGDLDGAAAVLLTIGDIDRENRMVRSARRRNIPVHVRSRPLVSDFTMLDLVERRAASFAR